MLSLPRVLNAGHVACESFVRVQSRKGAIRMKVKELMTSDVKCCDLNTNLAAAARIMW